MCLSTAALTMEEDKPPPSVDAGAQLRRSVRVQSNTEQA